MLMSRAEKYLLALRCLLAAQGLSDSHPRVHEQAIVFQKAMNEELESLPAKVQEVIKAEWKSLGATAGLKKVNDDFYATHKSSPRHVLSAIKVRRELGESKDKYEQDVVDMASMKDLTFEDAVMVLDTLTTWKSGKTEEFRKAALGRWPDVTRLQK